jgi:hypothetical protein
MAELIILIGICLLALGCGRFAGVLIYNILHSDSESGQDNQAVSGLILDSMIVASLVIGLAVFDANYFIGFGIVALSAFIGYRASEQKQINESAINQSAEEDLDSDKLD